MQRCARLAVADDRPGQPCPDGRAVLVQVALFEMVGIRFARAHALHRFTADCDVVRMRELEEGQRLEFVRANSRAWRQRTGSASTIRPSSPTTTTPIAESSMARRKRCSLSAMRRRSTRVCSMISPPSNGSITTMPTAELEAEGKAAIRRVEAGQARRRPPIRPAWRRPRRRRPPGRAAPGRRHAIISGTTTRRNGNSAQLDGRQREQRAGADDRRQPRQSQRVRQLRQTNPRHRHQDREQNRETQGLRRQPSART